MERIQTIRFPFDLIMIFHIMNEFKFSELAVDAYKSNHCVMRKIFSYIVKGTRGKRGAERETRGFH